MSELDCEAAADGLSTSVGVTLAITPRAAGSIYTRAMRPREMRLGSIMRARLATSALAVALAASLLAAPARAAGPTERRFVSARNGITVEAPTGWTLSTHTGFPNILVLLLHPDGSRISIAVSETQAKDAREVAEPNRRVLERQTGSAVTARAGARNGVELDGQAASRSEAIVQLYLVRALAPEGPRQAIVVSLIAPAPSLPLRRADLDFVIGKLGLTAITLPAPTAPAKIGAGGSSAGERGAEKERR
jgi:hypothetical protein